MSNTDKLSVGTATFLLADAAKRGDLVVMKTMLAHGANACCWVEGHRTRKRMPLVTAAAEEGQIESVKLLLEYVNDETIAEQGMDDWRKNYHLSPLLELVMAGEEDLALQMLEHCKISMNMGQWVNLLHNCCEKSALKLINECVINLGQEELLNLQDWFRKDGDKEWPEGWTMLDAAISMLGLESSTPVSTIRSGPLNRM